MPDLPVPVVLYTPISAVEHSQMSYVSSLPAIHSQIMSKNSSSWPNTKQKQIVFRSLEAFPEDSFIFLPRSTGWSLYVMDRSSLGKHSPAGGPLLVSSDQSYWPVFPQLKHSVPVGWPGQIPAEIPPGDVGAGVCVGLVRNLAKPPIHVVDIVLVYLGEFPAIVHIRNAYQQIWDSAPEHLVQPLGQFWMMGLAYIPLTIHVLYLSIPKPCYGLASDKFIQSFPL